MNKLKRNIIVLLVFGLILSVNYGAYADSVLDDQVSVPEEETKEIINLGDTVEDSAVEDDSSNVESEETQEELETENQEAKKEDNKDAEVEEQQETNAKEEQLDKETVQQDDIQEVSSEQTVSNWEEFVEAFNSETVEIITLTDNIDGTASTLKLEERSKSLEINSLIDAKYSLKTNDNSTETGTLFDLVGLENEPVFTVRNIRISHKGGHLIDASREKSNKWKIINDSVDVNLAASTESGIFHYYLNGDNIEKIQFINDNNINDADGFVLTPNAIVEINKAAVKSNDGISSKAVTIVNSEVDVLEGAGGLVASDYIKIDNSNVRIKTDYYGISVTDINVQKENKFGLLVKNNSELAIENKEKETIDTVYTKIMDSQINYVSGDQGIVSDDLDFINVKIDGDTVKDSIIAGKIGFTNVTGEIKSQLNVINASKKNEFVQVMVDDSKVKLVTIGPKSGFGIKLGNKNNEHIAQLIVLGEETQLDIVSTETQNNVLNHGGISIESQISYNEGRPTTISAILGANIDINVEDGQGIYSNVNEKGNITLQNGGKMSILQSKSRDKTDSAVKILDNKETSIIVENESSLFIESNSGPAPTLLFAENWYKSIISRGKSEVKITNNSSDFQGEVIKLLGTNPVNAYDDNFRVWAWDGSSIELRANKGSIIEGQTIVDIYATRNSIMNLVGESFLKSAPVIDAPTIKIENDDSMYFNIENKRNGGGKLFPQLSSNSELVQNIYGSERLSAPFAVWEHGQDVNGEPSKFWSKLNFELEGENLAYKSSSHEKEFNDSEESFGDKGLTAYSRISGNNAKPVINFTPDSYNTDKSIYGHVTVPEGLNGSRNAWEGEVQLELERTQADESKTVYDDISTHKSNGKAWGYEDYKIPKEQWGGYFKIDLDGFAVADDKYEIISAYRGQKDQEEERHIHSDLTEKEVTKKTIKDKTPPKIADIDEPVFEDQTSMGGKTSEKDITAKLYDKDKREIKDKDGNLLEVSDNDGVWEFDISNTDLKKGDKVYVVLKDKIGNFNPFKESTYHDATFKAAASIIISGPRFEISAEDLFTNQKGIVKISNKDNLKTKMKAKGRDNLKEEEIEVEISDLGGLEFEQSETINEVKSHKITFKLKDHDTTVIKSVHILPHDNIVQTSQYVIGASDFYTDKSDIDATEERVKELANAKAYKKEDMSEQDVRLKDFEKLQFDLPNKLKFVVEADEKVKVTVIGRVLNYDHVNNSEQYVVAANDFSIMDYLAVDIEDQTILDRSKAAGWIIEGWQEKDVKVVKHNVEGTVGQYKATIDIVK